jgi:uncharacterized protein (TIGR02266 family)
MADERRSARRARIAGVRVTYESAAGDRVDAHAKDLGRGGLFVRTTKPLAVGKRIALEIQVVGVQTPWAALGRVVWNRESADGEDRPAGMGVKLIDVEDAVVAAIDRLVDTREPTEPGVGEPPKPVPVPPRAPEASIPIDLIAPRKEPAVAAQAAPAAAAAPAPGAAPTEKRTGCGWLVVLGVLAAIAGVAAYVLFDGMFRPPPRVQPIPAGPATTVSSVFLPEPTASPVPPVASPPASASAAPSASSPKKPAAAPSSTPSGRPPTGAPKKVDSPY